MRPSVVGDNLGGSVAAVEHLIQHGHCRIAFVGNLGQTDMVERQAGYRRRWRSMACRSTACSSRPPITSRAAARVPPTRSSRSRATVTAVVAATDRVALGLVHALIARDVRVPQDIAVVGFDNVETGGRPSRRWQRSTSRSSTSGRGPPSC